MADSKQPFQLLKTNDNGSTPHKSNNGCMRKEVHKKTQSADNKGWATGLVSGVESNEKLSAHFESINYVPKQSK